MHLRLIRSYVWVTYYIKVFIADVEIAFCYPPLALPERTYHKRDF